MTHLLFDVLFEPLVLSVGHAVLGFFGVKPLPSKRWDELLAGTVGIVLWAAGFVGGSLLLS